MCYREKKKKKSKLFTKPVFTIRFHTDSVVDEIEQSRTGKMKKRNEKNEGLVLIVYYA